MSRRSLCAGLAGAVTASYADRVLAQDGGMTADAIFERARNDLAVKTAFHARNWQMDKASWSVDLDAGQIEFRNRKGQVVTAPVQVIGTRAKDDSWLWAWDNPSIPPARAAHARLVRKFGSDRKLPALTTRKIAASEADCWQYTALASYLAKAQGGYRGPTDGASVFMTFGTITIDGVEENWAPKSPF